MYKLIINVLLLFSIIMFNSCGGGVVESKTHKNNQENISRTKSDNAGFYALEVSHINGIPTIGGKIIDLDNHKSYFSFKIKEDIEKVVYFENAQDASLLGELDEKVVRIPNTTKFIKIYFIKSGGSSFKFFEILTNIE